jgi:CDP-diacylglycerol--glycerol-3-phosphate 3-phosphatidyltransferase
MATITPRTPASVFNLPNQLTTARLGLAFVLFGLIAAEAWWWCLFVFALAAVTDWLDGYFARLHGLTSALGRVYDPLVDKVLMGGTFIFLLPLGSPSGWLTPWMVTLVVSRELLITGLRNYLETMGVSFGADWLGKLKMVLQCAAVVAIFLVQAAPSAHLEYARNGLIYAMLLATLLSGLQYVWHGTVLIRKTEKASL